MYRGDWSRTDNCFMQNVTFLLQCGVLVCTAVILCRIGLFCFFPPLKFTRRLQNFCISILPPIVLALGELMAHNKRNEETEANGCDRCCTLTEAVKTVASGCCATSPAACPTRCSLIPEAALLRRGTSRRRRCVFCSSPSVIHFNGQASVVWE